MEMLGAIMKHDSLTTTAQYGSWILSARYNDYRDHLLVHILCVLNTVSHLYMCIICAVYLYMKAYVYYNDHSIFHGRMLLSHGLTTIL